MATSVADFDKMMASIERKAAKAIEKANQNPIAVLNDRFRKMFGVVGGRVVTTVGFRALPYETQSKLREQVEKFNAFTKDNDPYGEHDFGKVSADGVDAFWKFDYYDLTYTYGSEDPADPKVTRRVLTLMLAEEY